MELYKREKKILQKLFARSDNLKVKIATKIKKKSNGESKKDRGENDKRCEKVVQHHMDFMK